jgi:hypothetical protein
LWLLTFTVIKYLSCMMGKPIMGDRFLLKRRLGVVKMARGSTHHKKRAFLAAYAEFGNVSRSAKLVRIDRRRHYEWLEADPDYAAAFADAEEQAADVLEQEARRRAVDGLRRKKFTKDGKPIIDPETGKQYTEHEYSDTLLIFLLKGTCPEKYKDRVANEVSGNLTITVRLPGDLNGADNG